MYDQYADDIYRYLFVHVRDQQMAEDLTADTFMKVWKGLDAFDFTQPRPWLYKIARNTLIDHWRKKQPLPMDGIDEPLSDEDVEAEVDAKLARERVQAAVHELPVAMRSVVTMRFILRYSVRKTAESLGMSEANVRVVQYRALKKLKGFLQ